MQPSRFIRILLSTCATVTLLISIILTPVSPVIAASASEVTSSADADSIPAIDQQMLASHVEGWIQDLSKHAPFTVWKGAEYTISPLGPGLHSWLVQLTKQNKELGYLIVSATESQQLTLSEYGVGPSPLFSTNTLYLSLVQHGIIPSSIKRNQLLTTERLHIQRYYLHPMLAVWRVEPQDQPATYYNAKTGEQLLITDQEWDKQKNTLSQGSPMEAGMQEVIQPNKNAQPIASFDPFERINWLTHAPLEIKNAANLSSKLDQKARITYVSNWYQDTYLIPLAVSGYQTWGNVTYIMVHDEGARWIPFQSLAAYGKFYK
ncbi:hypothetical protein [Paenibacillus guangzhouensis]|uniref:hypothetical protein n=1 Tax=Paenibacillus guangzhouensis TaxID=1473112 RepID=UPI00126731D4|nr:hypothetical protein [Paenibacillus guangzhouensis]